MKRNIYINTNEIYPQKDNQPYIKKTQSKKKLNEYVYNYYKFLAV